MPQPPAGDISNNVCSYFMAQRIKPADPADRKAFSKYVHQLTLLHQIMVHAMQRGRARALTSS